MENKIGRKNLHFSLSDEKERVAFDFLNLLGRKQASFISDLVIDFLKKNGVTDINSLTRKELKTLLVKARVGQGVDTDALMQSLLSLCGSNTKSNTSEIKEIEKVYKKPKLGFEKEEEKVKEVKEEKEEKNKPTEDVSDETENFTDDDFYDEDGQEIDSDKLLDALSMFQS